MKQWAEADISRHTPQLLRESCSNKKNELKIFMQNKRRPISVWRG